MTMVRPGVQTGQGVGDQETKLLNNEEETSIQESTNTGLVLNIHYPRPSKAPGTEGRPALAMPPS